MHEADSRTQREEIMKRLAALVIPLLLILGLPATAQAASGDLSVSVAGPSTSDQGTEALYTVSYTNTGGGAATNVSLSVTLPTGLTVDPLNSWGGCIPATGFVATTCDIGTVPAGASSSHTIAISANLIGTYTIPFKITSEPQSSTNSDANLKETLQVVPATHENLLVQFVNTNVVVRATNTAGIQVAYSNSGPLDGTDVVITFLLPTGLQYEAADSDSRCAASGQTISCAIGVVAVGSLDNLAIGVSAAVPGSYPMSVSIQGDQPDLNTADNMDSFNLPFQPAEVNLGLGFGGTSVRTVVGNPVQFRVNVGNSGPDEATGVTLQVTFPAGWTVYPDVTDPRCSGVGPGVLSCALGVMPAETGISLVVAAIPPTAGTFTVTGTVSADQQVQGPQASKRVTIVEPSADLSVSVVASAQTTQGQPFQYSVIVTNNGPDTQSVVITSSFSTNVGIAIQGISFTVGTGTCSQYDNVVTCTTASLVPPGEVRVDMSLVATGTGTIDETSMATSKAQDPNPANNTATYSTLVS